MTDPSPESYAALERKLEACEAELAEERAYQSAISDVLQIISESPSDLQPVFDAIAARAIALCGASMGSAFRFDGELIHLMAFHGVSPEVEQATRAVYPMSAERRTVVARTIRDCAPVQTPDILNDPDHPDAPKEATRAADLRGILAVPMLSDGKCVGALVLGSAKAGLFPDKQIKLLETFAEQAVIAIENARLFNESQEALEQQTATAEILQIISESPSDIQPVFDAIAERAMTMCDALGAVTTRFDGELVHLMGVAGGGNYDAAYGMTGAFPMKIGQAGLNARAVLERAPVNVPDVLADPQLAPELKNAYETIGARSSLAVPMLRDGEVLGTIMVVRTEASLFPNKLVSLLETFAAQAVIAVENVRLFTETQEALEQQTAISEILRVISESPTDVQPVFDAIAERAMAMCNADIGVGTRFDGEWIHLAAIYGPSQETIEAVRAAFPVKPARNSVSGRIVLEQKTVQIPDLVADPEYTIQALMLAAGSSFGVPLMREGRIIGTLVVGRKETGLFPEKLVTLLQTFADQAVIAIENVRLFNETQEALERQTASSEILRVISESPTDVEPVFDAIGERAMTLCNADIGVATRFDGEWIHLSSIYGPSQETIDAVRAAFPVKPGRSSMNGRVVLERAPVQIPDLRADSEYAMPAAAENAGSALGVPLMREGQVVGTLMVGRNETGNFPDKLVSLLQTFADQAVIAIENVRLFKETQEALERQTATAEILRVISSSPTDVQPVFDTIAERAAALCNAEMGMVTRYDGELVHLAATQVEGNTFAILDEIFPSPPRRGLMTMRAILEGKPVQAGDVESVADYDGTLRETMRDT